MSKSSELREKLTDEQIVLILTKLGANRHEDRDSFLIFPTICHNHNIEDASMKLYYYKNTRLFHCYTQCSESFTIYELVDKVWQLRGYTEDERHFQNIFYFVLNFADLDEDFFIESTQYQSVKDKYRRKENLISLPSFPEGVLQVFNKRYPEEWLRDGISESSMDKFNILYSISQNKIIIPHFDPSGKLVGIRGRALNEWDIERGKYMPVKIEGQWYSHPLSLNLYGLNETRETIAKRKVAWIFESEKSVLQCDTFLDTGENVAVACCGSQVNRIQILSLIRLCSPTEIVICFDSEEEEESTDYFYKLYNICKKYGNYCSMSFIYDRDKLLKHKDSPSDRGREIFSQLLQKRVKVK